MLVGLIVIFCALINENVSGSTSSDDSDFVEVRQELSIEGINAENFKSSVPLLKKAISKSTDIAESKIEISLKDGTRRDLLEDASVVVILYHVWSSRLPENQMEQKSEKQAIQHNIDLEFETSGKKDLENIRVIEVGEPELIIMESNEFESTTESPFTTTTAGGLMETLSEWVSEIDYEDSEDEFSVYYAIPIIRPSQPPVPLSTHSMSPSRHSPPPRTEGDSEVIEYYSSSLQTSQTMSPTHNPTIRNKLEAAQEPFDYNDTRDVEL